MLKLFLPIKQTRRRQQLSKNHNLILLLLLLLFSCYYYLYFSVCVFCVHIYYCTIVRCTALLLLILLHTNKFHVLYNKCTTQNVHTQRRPSQHYVYIYNKQLLLLRRFYFLWLLVMFTQWACYLASDWVNGKWAIEFSINNNMYVHV